MGNAVAVDLAKQGWKVVILDINHEAGEQAASEINGRFFKADVRSWKEQFKAFERTFELFGRLDFGKLHAARQTIDLTPLIVSGY